MPKYYDWQKTMSYQTGTNGEVCLVIGAKDIGKTFGLRLKCIEAFIKRGEVFCEICRTKTELEAVAPNYFGKIEKEGFFKEWVFKSEKANGYIARRPPEGEKPDWRLICHFVSISSFQMEKKRTYLKPTRFIFDEAIIDTRDRFHRYLPDEFMLFYELLDTISRQQPGDDYTYKVYLLGNAVDLTSPYLRYHGITSIPEFGYRFYKNKHVLLHYVEPWDAQDRKAYTLVGRMLEGYDSAKTVFDNEFQDTTGKEIAKKSGNAKHKFSIRWGKMDFAIWVDSKAGYWYVNEKTPKDAKNVYTLAKKDSAINYQMVDKAHPYMEMLKNIYYLGGLRYSSAHVREAFFEVLAFLGIR